MPKVKERLVVDFDTWAASGGTIGIFGRLKSQGRLEIVSRELTATEQKALEGRLTPR